MMAAMMVSHTHFDCHDHHSPAGIEFTSDTSLHSEDNTEDHEFMPGSGLVHACQGICCLPLHLKSLYLTDQLHSIWQPPENILFA
jgi:hypothetical protein